MTRLGGLIAQVDNKITKKKEAMAVLRLEDLDGSVEVVVFPDTYREFSQFFAEQSQTEVYKAIMQGLLPGHWGWLKLMARSPCYT